MSLTARIRRQWAANRSWTTEVREFFSAPATRSRWRRAGLRLSASHLHAGMTGHLLHVLGAARLSSARGALRPDPLHVKGELHLARFFELKRDRNLVALLERALEIEQHQMITARRKLDGLPGLDRKTLVERPHRHHAIACSHLVDLDLIGDIVRAADQPIRRRALVLNGQISP